MVESPNIKQTLLHCLRNIEGWLKSLTTNMQNSNDTVVIFDEGKNIEETCSYMVDHFLDGFSSITSESCTEIIIKTLNILIRIYDADKFYLIISHKAFRRLVEMYIGPMNGIDLYTSIGNKKCAAEMLDLLLMDFAQDDFLVKCLKQFFLDKPAPVTESVTIDEQQRQGIINDAKKLVSYMIDFAKSLAAEADIQLAEEFNNNYESLMKSLLEFVDSIFARSKDDGASVPYASIIRRILALPWNLTDKIPLVPMFVAANYPKMVTDWLINKSFVNINKGLIQPIITIIYNLSRHKKGLKALQAVETFEILMKLKSFITEMQNNRLTERFSMLLIALSKSDKEQQRNEDLIKDTSKALLFKTRKAFNEPNWDFEGCHLSEYLFSLQGAFSNPLVVQCILGHSRDARDNIKFFVDFLRSVYGLSFNQDQDDLEKIIMSSILNIILYISIDIDYRDELNDQDFLRILVEAIAKQPGQDVAKRILCNLQQSKDSKSSPDRSQKGKIPSIYISYNWADEEFCKIFIDALRKHTNLPIWVDYEQTNELQDPWETVASAIDFATIIIVLTSNAYIQSKSNRQELTYAMAETQTSDEAKSFIIVKAVPNFELNRDWIHVLLKQREPIPYSKDTDKLAKDVAHHAVLYKYRKHVRIPFSFNNNTIQSRICTIM